VNRKNTTNVDFISEIDKSQGNSVFAHYFKDNISTKKEPFNIISLGIITGLGII
jgi:hypothetical protein